MTKKKILHISTYFYPSAGGVEQVALDTATALNSLYDQTVICFNNSRKNESFNICGFDVQKVGVTAKFRSQALSIFYFFKLFALLKNNAYDAIHFHAPNPLISVYLSLALTLTRSKPALVVHWHSDIIEQKFLKKIYIPFQRSLLENASKIIVTSLPYKKSVDLKSYPDKVVIIPNAYNDKKMTLTPQEQKKADLLKGQRMQKVVLFAGRHVGYKGLPLLIEAAAELQNFHFIIAGEGPLTESLKKMIKSPNVEFIGKISDSLLRVHMESADIFALPSISKNEAFGVVLAEAGSLGKPCVVFDIIGSGVPWVIQQGITGVICDEMTSKSLASSIKSACNLIPNAPEIRMITEERFSFEKVYRKSIVALYQTLLWQRE